MQQKTSFIFIPYPYGGNLDYANRSAIHGNLVCIQTEEYGGGEIYLDGRLLRRNGRFVLPELAGLNPENLK